MVRISICLALVLFGILGYVPTPAAQTGVDPNLSIDLIDPARELEDRLERERLEEEIRRFQSSNENKPSLVNPESPDEGPCVNIFDIQIEGVSLLSESYMDSLLEGRFPGCLRRFHISDLMRTLDKAYVDKGYITARTYIPKQDIEYSGLLKLVVVEGIVEKVVFSKNGEVQKPSDFERRTAFPNIEGEFLNIRDFEQGLEQLNRLNSVNAKMRLEPGEGSGGSIVQIDTRVEDRYRGYFGFDNLGSRSTGERQLRFQLGADGIFSANDVGSLVYVGSTNANAINGALSIPIGYNTFTASASISDYLLPLSDVSELLSNTRAYTLSVNRVLSRDAQSITSLSAALRYRESERFINGVALTPQNTTVIDARWRRISNREKARWSYELGVRSGLPWFGGQTDIGRLGSDIPHAEFQTIDFAVTRIGKQSKQGRWTTSLRGQYADYALLGSEQFSLGSQSTVRGFDDPLLGGEAGAALRVEASLPMPKLKYLKSKMPDQLGKAYDSLRQKSGLYIFSDFGGVYSHGLEEGRFAAGVGFGYRFSMKRAQIDLGFQTGVVDLGKGRLQQGDNRLTVSTTLKAF